MGRIICHHSGLEHLRACAGAGHFIEIEGALLGDPGPGILDAAELVFKKAYGE
jgi:iron complex transport system substrate-binding protein